MPASQTDLYYSRERVRSLGGIPRLFRTHEIRAAAAIPVADIDAAQFPVRDAPITFKTAIRILANTGSHKGLIFELGDAAIGVAAWVEDNRIGFHAGEDGVVNGATALFDFGAELTVGQVFKLVFAARPGDGRVRMWSFGNELARGTASSDGFGTAGEWAASSNGSLASAVQGTVVLDVPVASRIAPDGGFEVIEPLSVYVGQVPRHFT